MSASKFSKATVCFVCFSLIFAVALIAAFSCGIIEMPAISSEITAEAATGAATTGVLRDGEVASGYSPSGTGISNIDTARSNLKGTYYLMQNITITTLAVADNSDGVNIFSGTFDGNGKTITIKAAPEAQCTNGSIGGLFAILQGTVKNCNIVVETFCARFKSGSSWANAGIIAGAGGEGARVENVYITLKHSPTSMAYGSDNAYLSQYGGQSSKDSSMRLGGVFGNIIGNVTVTDTTVDNQTSGSYGFCTYGYSARRNKQRKNPCV